MCCLKMNINMNRARMPARKQMSLSATWNGYLPNRFLHVSGASRFVSATGLPLGTPKVFADKVNGPVADYLKKQGKRNCGIVFIDFVGEPGGKALVEYLIDSNVCAK